MSKSLATCIGLSAILLWASIIALIKKVSLLLGPDFGILLIYSFSTVIVAVIFGFPSLQKIPKKFLLITTLLFVSYEFCLSYAIALTSSERQAIEVSILNYLWPSFTIVALLLVKEFKFNLYIFIGLNISILGVGYIQTNGQGVNISYMLQNISANPIVYLLALSGAVIWAIYCVMTRTYKIKQNPIALYFLVISILLWVKFLIYMPDTTVFNTFSFSSITYVILAAFALGIGYAAWNIGIVHGNISVLVASSYFTPILSSIVAVFMLNTTLPGVFWQGVIAVTVGSLICWLSTNNLYLIPRIRRFIRKFI